MKKPSRRSRSQTSAPRDRAAGSSPPSSPPRSQHSATPDRLQQIAQLGQSGDLQTAAQRCQQFLQQHPQDATAWHLLSVIRSQQQQWQLALEPIEIALQLVPDRADFLSQAGVVYCGMGQLKRGIAAYQQALQLQPALHHTRFNLGLAWQKLGKIHRAEAAYQDLLDRQPEYAPARLQLGNLAQQQKQFLKAIEHYRQAIQQDAQLTTAWCNLGVALQAIGDLESAKPAFQTALQQNPDYVEAHNGLGAIYEQQEQAETARYHYRQALDRQPDHLPALINWANLHLRLEEFAIAESTLQQILQQQPDRVAALDQQIKLSLLTATWDDWPRQIDRFKRAFQTASTQCSSSPATEDLITPLNSLYLPFSAAEQQVIAQQYVQSLEQRMVDVKQQFQDWVVQHPVDRSHHTKIRLGYVSGDFRYHAVGQLILRLFELHDRQKFAVFAYSLGLNDQSLERQKFERDCDCFREMQGQSVLTIAQQVYQDEIDILIDLAGYTNYACPELFCLQPAPLQINYLGYPGTLGAAYIDYIITDTTIAPPSIAQHFTEQCIYLPETYQLNCYPYPEAVDRVASPNSAFLATNPTDAAILDPIQQELALRSLVSPQQLRQAQGLPSHGFVFCCFNKVQKIEPTMFAVWMRILQQVPQSILWLLSDRPEVETQLRSQAAQQGIQPDRLQFAPRVPKEQHLQRLRAADLFLDTQYYNAHVTASDALWAGVPVLTLQGETFASRVGASLLHAIGLPDLITHSLEEYEQFAVHLATHKTALKAFQHWLGHRRSTCALFNTAQTIRDLESGYALIWQQHQAGLPPVHVHVVRDDIARDDIAVSDALHSNALDNDIANNLDRIDIKHNYIISNDSHDIASNSHCSQRNVSRETIPVSIAAEVSLTARADVGFQNWLHQMQGSLLITTYQAGKILLVGAVDHQITLLARSVQRPMGVAVSGDRLAIAMQQGVLFFRNTQALASHQPDVALNQYDSLYLPRSTYWTGDLYTHELGFGQDGLWVVNTRFSCLAHLSLDFSFIPRWYPAFISEIAPDDRCHLNGLAMVDHQPKYVTALGATNQPNGWRSGKSTGGVLIDVETDQIIKQGLSMPHSPRWHQNKLWLLNSGTGELWCLDPQTWEHQVVCRLPGFGRGLGLVGNYAVIGLSQFRDRTPQFGVTPGTDLPILAQSDRLICGIAIVDLQTGQQIGRLEFPTGCQELFAVQFLPQVKQANLLLPDHPTSQAAFTAPEFAYWLRSSQETSVAERSRQSPGDNPAKLN